jgi:hypothetical protein
MSSLLAGSYVAVKGGMYIRVLLSVAVATRIALLGRQPYGKKLPKEVTLEQGSLMHVVAQFLAVFQTRLCSMTTVWLLVALGCVQR